MVPLRRRPLVTFPVLLVPPAPGHAAARDGRALRVEQGPESIGVATMLPDGTIVLDLRALGPGGIIGDARLTYRPDDPRYQTVRDHLPDLRPGGTVRVPPFN